MTRFLIFAAVAVVAFLVFRAFTSGGESRPVADVAQAIADGAQVVDVRTAGEYAGGHVAGAVHANVLDPGFDDAVADLDPTAPVYVYCASGARSGRAAGKLESMGFETVVNAGGLDDLAKAGVATER